MKLCCIVGAGPSELYIENGALIIAADAGIEKLNKAGIMPDLIMGDFDSLGTRPSGENVRVFPIEKDDTDTMLALKEAISLGYDTVIISGGLGGKSPNASLRLRKWYKRLFDRRHHDCNCYFRQGCLSLRQRGQMLGFCIWRRSVRSKYFGA